MFESWIAKDAGVLTIEVGDYSHIFPQKTCHKSIKDNNELNPLLSSI